MKYFDPQIVEKKWQEKWREAGTFSIDFAKAKDPYYALVMFSYPSGDRLHIGHWYNFAPTDSFARYMRMQGKDVFEPMGFDSFGLPAENYAIKSGIHPATSTANNIATMQEQLKRIGCMYDWSKTLQTSEPEYYRWTQWVFLQMLKHGIAYKKLASVNYCPVDQTVLANEQVKDGNCDRCGSPVVQKPLTQWFWNITKYAEKLVRNLDDLDWPEKTKTMQRNWIGRSEGAEIRFAIEGHEDEITVFTTRADTLFGVTYVVLAPEHPLVETITPKNHKGAIDAYRKEVAKKTELQRTDLNKEKSGVATGAFALHPVTGERLPVWVADYVLASYGTGAVMAVPAHDERDFEFARRHGLNVKRVIAPDGASSDAEPWTGGGTMIDSDFLNGLASDEAVKKMIAWLESAAKGRELIQYRLKDWLISRQRYWGAPIPVVYDPQGNPHPVPEEHLPWLLPTDVEFKPSGESPLSYSRELKERTEKIFGKGWTPEYDTMDTFVCSSFYYLRYLAGGDAERLIDATVERRWMPVDVCVGGAEHACMHLIYARFVMMALKDFGFVSHEEPFKRLIHQGMITNKGAKMSKSKGNAVSPDSYVAQYGSDVFRMYLMFMGPYTAGGDWSDSGINGIDRFVQRAWKTVVEKSSDTARDGEELTSRLHRTIKAVGEQMQGFRFNTAISSMMELLNAMEDAPEISRELARTYVILLSPLAPHLAEEAWERLGGKGFAAEQRWPAYDPALLESSMLTIAVQVNGKLRGDVVVPADASPEDIIAAAKRHENVAKHIEGKTVKKEMYVKGRLVSIVL